jgi:hypothetical protein
MNHEQRAVKALFKKLKRAKLRRFPDHRKRMDAPELQGVYVIYSPRRRKVRKVVHVGRTYRGTAGLRQRLRNHLHGASSFTIEFLKGHGRELRNGYAFRYLPVRSARRRALLEHYAAGCLCPAHIGLSD